MTGSEQFANFWSLEHAPDSLAVIEAHTGLGKTYGQLRSDVESFIGQLPASDEKLLFLLLAQNRYECLVAYLAALKSGHALLVVDATLSTELLDGIVKSYHPALILSASVDAPALACHKFGDTAGMWQLDDSTKRAVIHPSLALLLSTSGSTGSPKFVRLTLANLQANAVSIATYLELTPSERPITSLPMAYSYGLSVIHSHLLVGGCLVLSEHGVLRREFWDSVDNHACTSFSGVPYTYQMLLQMGLLKKRGATLRTLTQAGGKLSEAHVRQMHELATERGARFVVMYGQTEATARISYLPFAELPAKAGSIGIAIPGGSMRIETTGELVYEGPNVMMGYASGAEDLAKGDDLHGVLETGDLARQDPDGFFYITGRLQRFLKLFGRRFSLDEVEQFLQRRFDLPVACFGQDDQLIVAIANGGDAAAVATTLRQTFGLPGDVVSVTSMSALPRTSNGKIDYRVLAESCAPRQAAKQVAQ